MILAIDQGTTGSTCLVSTSRASRPEGPTESSTSISPGPGGSSTTRRRSGTVTHAVAGEALADAGVRDGELDAVGITNQRETIVVWDPASGEPLAPAIVWQDRRTAARCDELRAAGHELLVRERTGLVLDPYFSGTKIEWLLDNVDGLRERARDGRAVFGTIDAWVIFKLTGELATDASNASRTMLFDISRGTLGRRAARPDGRSRACPARGGGQLRPLATTTAAALHGHAVPVAGIAGDQQAALFGQACVDPGLGKNTYGTGSFVLQNAGPGAPRPPTACSPPSPGESESGTYATEASIFDTLSVQWLRDGLGVIEVAAEPTARSVSGEQ